MAASPPLPRVRLEDTSLKTIKNIQIALERLRNAIPNMASEAILPSDIATDSSGPNTGGGGTGVLTIVDTPTINRLTPGSAQNAINYTQESFIDVDYTLPPNATGVTVHYKEANGTQWRQTTANDNPYRLLHLQPGIDYDIKLSGIAANNTLGPTSTPQSTSTTSDASAVAPNTAHYVTTQSEPALIHDHVLTGETDVISINTPEGIARVGIAPQGVTTAKLADLAVTTPKVANNAITTPKIADTAVTTPKIGDSQVTNAKLRDSVALSVIGRSTNTTGEASDIVAEAANTVLARNNANVVDFFKITQAMMDPNTVGNTELADNSVSEPKLQSNAVTISKIADNAVGTAKLLDANVTTAKIADNNITTAKILDANITTAKIADANISTAKLIDSSVTTAKRQLVNTMNVAVSLTGTGAASQILTTTATFDHNLGKTPLVTVALASLTGASASAAIVGVNVQSHGPNQTIVRVVGLFFASTATIGGTVFLFYW